MLAAAAIPSPDAAGRHERLDYLDGMRALAALAVVVLHAFEMYGLGLGWLFGIAEGTAGLGRRPLDQGFVAVHKYVVRHFAWAVEIFIVLSGFSLMLPIVRSVDGRLKGGARYFFQRRARRILPPYYAAVALSLLLIAVVPGMAEPSGSYDYRDLMLPALETGPVLSHLLLVHNVSPEWNLAINPPLWTIAVEWQIYVLFPLLVIVWRRAGVLPMLGLALTLGIAQAMVRGRLEVLTYPLSYSWFLGLFGLGMTGAVICFSQHATLRKLREQLPWLVLSTLGVVAAFAIKLFRERFGGLPEWPADTMLGFAILCLLIHLSRAARTQGRPSWLLRLLSAAPLVRIGHISYSLYLVHAPLLVALAIMIGWLELPALVAHLAVLLLGVPLSLGVAYLFFMAFERPFLSSSVTVASSALPTPEHNLP